MTVRRMVSIEAGSDVRTFSHHYDGPLRIFVNDDCVYDSETDEWRRRKEAYLAGRKKGMEEEGNWYLMDEDTGKNVRGPYKHAESASAVREELETRWPNKEWNLQIVREAKP